MVWCIGTGATVLLYIAPQIQKLLCQNLEWHTELPEFYGCIFRITWAAKKLTAAITKINWSSPNWLTGSNQSVWLVVLLMVWDAWAPWSIYFRFICRPVIWSGWTVRTLRLQPVICCCHPLYVSVTTTNIHNGRISDVSALYVWITYMEMKTILISLHNYYLSNLHRGRVNQINELESNSFTSWTGLACNPFREVIVTLCHEICRKCFRLEVVNSGINYYFHSKLQVMKLTNPFMAIFR
jgi:hypothetical protein